MKARRNSSTPAAIQPASASGTRRWTIPSTTGRGANWISPSSGRMSRSTAPTGDRAATPSTEPEEPGARRDPGVAGRPRGPPDRRGCCRPDVGDRSPARRADRRPRREVAGIVGRPQGLSESPKPGRSAAMTRNSPASAATVGRNDPFVPPSPWRARTTGPLPASTVETRARRVAIVRNPSRAGIGRAARGRQEPDPEVQVAADRQAA